MKTQSKDKLEKFQVIGKRLLINFNEQEVSIEDEIHYKYDSADCKITDSRNTIISKIIHSKYPYDEELALINNKDLSTEGQQEYEEYQSFRMFAKQTADEWVVTE